MKLNHDQICEAWHNCRARAKHKKTNMLKLSDSYFCQDEFDIGWYWGQIGYAVLEWIEEMDERFLDE